MDIIRFVDRIASPALNANPYMEAANPSSGGSNPGFETGSVTPWFANSGTVTVTQDVVRSGLWAGKLTANGSANPRAIHSESLTFLVPGQDYTISGWILAPTAAAASAKIALQWYTVGGAFISQSDVLTTLTPGVWTYLEGSFTAPATAERGGRLFGIQGTPASGTVLYGDDLEIRPALPTSWTNGQGGRAARSTAFAHEGTGSLRITPDGVALKAEAQTEVVPVLPGQNLRASAWVRCAASRNVTIYVNWFAPGGVYMSTTLVPTAVTANTWTFLDTAHASPVMAGFPSGPTSAQLIIGLDATPPASAVLYVDEAILQVDTGSPGGTATVRMDLNDGTTWGVNYDGTDFSPPPLKQAWSNTLLSDGERLSASAYANRQIQLSMDLMPSTPDGAAAEMQKLWRELNRPSNFLMYQPQGATNPVYFRTLRSSNTRVSELPSGSMRIVNVSIDAEPFAYGPKEQLPTVTVTNDPASGSNPMVFDVPSPKGDVETPLYMAIQGSSVIKPITAGDTPKRPMSAIAVRRRGTPSATPFVLQAEQLEPLSSTAAMRDVLASAPGSTYSGSGSLSPTLNANPTFETNVTNWTGTFCTLARDTTQFNSGVASMKMTCAGGQPQATAESEKITIDPTKLYGATAFVRIAVARPVDVAINWYTSGDVYIGTSTIARATVSTLNTWVPVDHLGPGKPPPTAAKASMTVVLQGTPAASEVMFIDDASIGVATHLRVNNVDVTASMKSIAQMALYPATPSVDARGTYRVFMRYAYKLSGSADDIMCRLWWGNGIFNGNVVLKRPSGGLIYADLGLVNIPGGYDPVSDGVSGVEVAPEGIYLNLQLQDTPGFTSSSALDIDHFLFFPADDRLLLALWQNRINAPAPTDVLLDSATGQVYSRNASGQPGMLTGHELAGGPPMVTPGVSNRVFFALDVGTEQYATPVSRTATYTVTPHYWPRYLTVRPVSS